MQGARKYLVIGDRERMTVRMDFKDTDLGLAPLLPTEALLDAFLKDFPDWKRVAHRPKKWRYRSTP